MSSIEAQTTHPSMASGWGVDLRPEDRPGVPEEMTPPRPMGNPHWSVPEQQTRGPVTAGGPLRRTTPVYGTAIPPRGLSGLVRRAAYRVPDYHPRRWIMLVLADRIDVLEHNVRPLASLAGFAALGFFGLMAVRRLLRD